MNGFTGFFIILAIIASKRRKEKKEQPNVDGFIITKHGSFEKEELSYIHHTDQSCNTGAFENCPLILHSLLIYTFFHVSARFLIFKA